jgi:hypothetical protein
MTNTAVALAGFVGMNVPEHATPSLLTMFQTVGTPGAPVVTLPVTTRLPWTCVSPLASTLMVGMPAPAGPAGPAGPGTPWGPVGPGGPTRQIVLVPLVTDSGHGAGCANNAQGSRNNASFI